MSWPNGARRNRVWVLGLVGAAAIGVLAWSRVGLLDLPPAPSGIGLSESGLGDLSAFKNVDRFVHDGSPAAPAGFGAPLRAGVPQDQDGSFSSAVVRVRQGIVALDQGDAIGGLELMRQGVAAEPNNLALGNALRMAFFRLRRDYLRQAKREGRLSMAFPEHLHRQPILFFEELSRSHPLREVKLQAALSWVDEMLLFPALEIKAPASVESVRILNDILEHHPGYVPALFARGLNHLHRPARLVWPETRGVSPDAAAGDIGLAVAIGRRLGVGSDHLKATLALALGDAYVKAGRSSVARSWWQIAENACREPDMGSAVRKRYGWQDEELIDRLESELDRARNEPTRPLTDLAVMWN